MKEKPRRETNLHSRISCRPRSVNILRKYGKLILTARKRYLQRNESGKYFFILSGSILISCACRKDHFDGFILFLVLFFLFLKSMSDSTILQQVTEWVLHAQCVGLLRKTHTRGLQNTASKSRVLTEWIPRAKKRSRRTRCVSCAALSQKENQNNQTNIFKYVFIAEREKYSFFLMNIFLPKGSSRCW